MIDISRLHDKLNILFTINVFEPITKEELIAKVTTVIDISKFEGIIKQLIEEKRIMENDNHFRDTYLGLMSLGHGKGRILRDTARLYNLSRVVKRGGI
jgi:hypothetical protein